MLIRKHPPRKAVATVEMAFIAPLLAFLFLIAVDYGRIYYHSVTFASAARNGAMYGSGRPERATDLDGIRNAVLEDTANITPSPDVTSTTGNDAEGHPYVEVTISYTFHTLTRYPGLPEAVFVQRTARMRVAPLLPKNS
jgi:Flp pilus assembly protein TadG